MSKNQVGRFNLFSRISHRISRTAPYLFIPAALVAITSFVAFRHTAVVTLLNVTAADSIQLPAGWPMPPVPGDNPITSAKFVLGRQLFYETALSGDGKTSCGTCHNSFLSFGAHGPRPGAFGDSSAPFRNVPRLVNIGYDTVLTWDGHIKTLEEQVAIAVQKKGDLLGDTTLIFPILANNRAYNVMFTQAFGDSKITLDRISKAVATFERCLISGNSPYDQYLNGDSSAFSKSAKNGMKLFFDTNQTSCAHCHNNLNTTNPLTPGNTFTDNNYYRTGTFEFQPSNSVNGGGGGGYGLPDTTADTLADTLRLDAGRAAVTRDTADIGKFKTPTLRNVAIPNQLYGADATVDSLDELLANYNAGGTIDLADFGRSNSLLQHPSNQDPRIQPLNLTTTQLQDLAAFLDALTDVSYQSNQAFQDPGAASIVVDDRIISGNLSTYPNPASDFVNVDCPDFTGITEASLISERGVTVWRQTLTADGKLRLDLSNITNGSYRLELSSGDIHQAGKIVIKR